jgi:hypothetical protein
MSIALGRDAVAARVAKFGTLRPGGPPCAPPRVFATKHRPIAGVANVRDAGDGHNSASSGACPSIKTAIDLSWRLNTAEPAAIANMHKVAVGVDKLAVRPGEAFVGPLYWEAAGRRRTVRERRSDGSLRHYASVAVGTTWSCDVSRRFVESVASGNH